MAKRKDVLQIVLQTDGQGRVKASLAGVSKELDTLEGKERKANAAAKTLTNTLGVFASVVGAGIAINTIAEFERLDITLNNLGVSFDEVKKITSKVPFQLSQIADASIKLKAFGLDPLDGTMQALIDQSSNLGGSQETLNGIILAVGQAWAKQKLQGEEILQLVERGVPVWSILEKTLGKNAKQLQKMSEKGELGRDAIRGLIDEMGRSNFGAAADQMDTVGGAISNLKDSADQLIASLGEAGLSTVIKSSAGFLGDLAEGVRENKEEFIAVAAVIAAIKLGPLAASAGLTAHQFIRARIESYQLQVALAKMEGASAKAARGMLATGAAARGLSSAMAFLGGPAGIIAGGVTALSLWALSSDDASESTQTLNERIDTLLGNYDKIKEKELDRTLDDITAKMYEQAEAIKQIKKNASVTTAPLSGSEIAKIDALNASLMALGTQYGLVRDKRDKLNAKNTGDGNTLNDDTNNKRYELELKRQEALNANMLELSRSFYSEKEQADVLYWERKTMLENLYLEGKVASEEERRALELQITQEHEESLTAITQKETAQRAAAEQRVSAQILAMKYQVAQQSINLLSLVVGESKAGQIVVLGLQKGLAIAQISVSTQVAMMQAMAQLGPIAGPPAAAGIAKMGALSAGLVVATGIVQAANIASGGGAPSLGSPTNPINTQPASVSGAPTPASSNSVQNQTPARSGNQTVFNLVGRGTFDSEQVADMFAKFKEAIDRGDEVLISPNSRQALELSA